MILGNSLTYCTMPEEEDDKTKRGLVSSDINHDYAHLLMNRISDEKQVDIEYTIINISDFERTFAEYPFNTERLGDALVKEPDFLIVQIGENVNGEELAENYDLFKERYLALLNSFPGAKKIIAIPFWPDSNKEYAVTEVAVESSAYLVDLSHLGSGADPLNFAKSEKDYAQAGVGEHPGNYGMEKIAECFYAAVNVLMGDDGWG